MLKGGIYGKKGESADAPLLGVVVRVANTGKEPVSLSTAQLVDKAGRTFDVTSKAYGVENVWSLDRLNPGVAKSVAYVFDVPQKDREGKEIEYYLKVQDTMLFPAYAIIPTR